MGLFNRTLGVVLTADTKRMERGLDRAERKLAVFGKSVSASKGGLGSTLIGGKAGAAFLGGGAAAVAFGKIVNAAKESEVVLGQTQVAVDALGLSYARNADLISSKADEISKASAFDDEDVLRSFQVLVRGTKDVGKALELSGLAADVARGRYISLEQATMIVTKANMGQIGALRRVGIQIDKNATSTEALAALQKAYGGAATKYANSAAGAQDKLNVAIENVAESAGSALTPAIVTLSETLVEAIENSTALTRALADLAKSSPIQIPVELTGGGGGGPGLADLLQMTNPGLMPAWLLGKTVRAVRGDGAAGAFVDSGRAGPRSAGQAATVTSQSNNPNWKPLLTAEQNLLIAQRKAAGTVMLKDDLKNAQDLAAFYEKRVADSKNAKDRTAATLALIDAQNDVADIQREMADRAKADGQTQRDRLKAAAEKARKATKDLADRLEEQAQGFKDAIISALDRKQDNLDTKRAVADAKKALAQARVLGGPETIKLAKRDLEDAYLSRERFLADNAKVTASKGGGYSVVINGLTMNGVTDAKQFLAQLQRLAKQNAAPTTGRYPAHGHGGR